MAHKKKELSFPIIANERLGTLEETIPRVYNHCFPEDSRQGKHAQTEFIDLYQNENYLIGLAFPKTGRQHQIRSHAAHHGFPLIGDKLYNGDPTVFMRFKDFIATEDDHKLMQIPRHALHAIANHCFKKFGFGVELSILLQLTFIFDLLEGRSKAKVAGNILFELRPGTNKWNSA